MISEAEWNRAVQPLHACGERMEHLLRSALEKHGVRTHTITHRVKSRDSATRKIDRKAREDYSLADLTDLLGMRVITHFDFEVDQVAEIIEAEFAIDRVNSVDKRTTLDPDRFGYLSLHYVVTVGQSRRELAEYSAFTGIKFEIQIRSILQHAWAEIEHDLGYKSDRAIPAQLRRRFSRLAGLLELADEEFTHIRRSVDEHGSEVEEAVRGNALHLPIDRESVAAYIRESARLAELERRIVGVGDGPASPPVTSRYAEARARELLAVGFTDLDDVDRVLREDGEVLWRFVRNWFDHRRRRPRRPNQGVVLLYAAVAAALQRERGEAADLLDRLGIGSDLLDALLVELDEARRQAASGT